MSIYPPKIRRFPSHSLIVCPDFGMGAEAGFGFFVEEAAH
ncbi:MAG: hypothetical protein RLZZ157_898, partial [Pseudomonadota bacterium]